MIKTLEIKKFRGIENQKFDFGNVNVFTGDNETGKSTCLDSILWVICLDTMVYGKNNDGNLDVNSNKEIDVKITLDNGKSIQRIFNNVFDEEKNKWQTKNEYYVNDRKLKSQKEYVEYVNNIFNLKVSTKAKNINLTQALIDINYLGLKLDEKSFREFISELTNGAISESEIIARNLEEYECIKNDLEMDSYDCNRVNDFYNQKISKYKNEVERLKVISNNYSNLDFNQEEYDQVEKELQDLIANYKPLTASDEITQKSNELLLKQQELINSQNEDNIKTESEEEKTLKKEVNKISKELDDIILKGNNSNRELTKINSLLKTESNLLDYLIKNKQELQERTFEEIICPHCNKVVNENGLNEFNKNKADEIKKLNKNIADKKERIESLKTLLDNENKNHTELVKNYLEIKNKYELKNSLLNEFLNENNKTIVSDKTKALKSQYDTLYKELSELKENFELKNLENYNSFDKKRNELQNKLNCLSNNKKDYDKKLSNDLELKKAKKEQYDYETKKATLKKFKKESILELKKYCSTIFGDDIEFEMINENVDGNGYTNCCYVKIKGVKQSGVNDGQKFLVGIKLIERIKKHIGGCDLPIIFMNSNLIGAETWKEIAKETNAQIFMEEMIKNQKELKLVVKEAL